MTSSRPDWLPAPHQLEQAPELAILAALDKVLELAACALQVAHPELLADQDCPCWASGEDRLFAKGLLQLFEDLHLLLDLYRDGTLRPADVVEESRRSEPPAAAPSDDDFPF